MYDPTGRPVVSVGCICYNQAKYLRQALDSVVCQKTDFSFEILVHDDASTDGSQQIIREYQKQYPNLIFPILQTENQYSKGIRISSAYLWPRARGEFYVSLECDDFWCDSLKLQKQVNAMRKHPECVMCAHRVLLCDEEGKLTGHFLPKEQIAEQKISAEKMVHMVASDDMFHTSSRLLYTKILREFATKNPEWYACSRHVGDAPQMLFLAQKGDAYFLSDVMTCYRQNSIGSFSDRSAKDNRFFITVRYELAEMWHLFAEESPCYKKIADQAEFRYRKQALLAELQTQSTMAMWKTIHGPQKKVYEKLSGISRMKLWVRTLFPWLIPIITYIKRALNK